MQNRNLLGYKIEQESHIKEYKVHANVRPIFILVHLYMLIIYHFTEGSFFFRSFYGEIHFFYYYGFLVTYMLTLQYFSKSCESPGYATDESDVEFYNEKNPDESKYHCKHCKIYVPIRTSHCSICKKCVIRRDHHCPYTNVCVGRDNHVSFFFFTFFEFFSQSIPCIDLVFNFVRYLLFSERYSVACICFFLQTASASSFGAVKTAKMLQQCVMVMAKNKTTWERVKREHITYLRDFPFGYSPFDKGVVENLKEFFSMKEKRLKWEVRPADISLFSNELKALMENNGELYD